LLNSDFIDFARVESPAVQPLLNLAIEYICIGTDEGKKPFLAICSK
jgi:hypothetical protein